MTEHSTETAPPAIWTTSCTCPCGCVESVVIAMDSPALRRHARCGPCLETSHAHSHQGTRVEVSPTSTKHGLSVAYVPTEDETRIANEARTAHEKEMWNRAWDRWQASIPVKFRNATTSLPELQECIARIRSGVTAVSGAAIGGNVGRGKTWEAIGFANDTIKEGLLHPSEVLFGTEGDLLASVANSPYGDVEKGFRRLTSGRYRMIIIDDIGRGAWLREDMRQKIFSRVFDNMWANNNIVVVTTNLSINPLEEYIGTAAVGRLQSMVGLKSIFIHATDKRKETTQEILASVKTQHNGNKQT